MDNLASLTRSHTVLAAKKRAKRQQIPEIVFDDAARRDFLTGFHKRKLAKADAARKRAQEREKQLRADARREQRRALREKAIENANKIEGEYAAAYGGSHGEDEEEWPGITSTAPNQRDEEYEDEQVLATVTVVEDFDPGAILHEPPRPASPTRGAVPHPPMPGRTGPGKLPPRKKLNSQKIRYQTKGARVAERRKQLARRNEKAERAGGKASRKLSSKNTGKSRR